MKVNTFHLTPNGLFSFYWMCFNVIKIVITIVSLLFAYYMPGLLLNMYIFPFMKCEYMYLQIRKLRLRKIR